MLSLRMGVWKKDTKSGSSSSGSFTILGKKFVVFVDENQSDRENAPDFWVTIKEYEPKKNDP